MPAPSHHHHHHHHHHHCCVLLLVVLQLHLTTTATTATTAPVLMGIRPQASLPAHEDVILTCTQVKIISHHTIVTCLKQGTSFDNGSFKLLCQSLVNVNKCLPNTVR